LRIRVLLGKKRLELTWNWIAEQTKENISNNNSVVIDFVVEDELAWFVDQMRDFNFELKYVVLIADKETIKKRLKNRDGDLQFFERSKTLMYQLKEDSKNKGYLVDTSD